ncbi:8739_t:CDS:1, partial [Cetraspora pellucida]
NIINSIVKRANQSFQISSNTNIESEQQKDLKPEPKFILILENLKPNHKNLKQNFIMSLNLNHKA